MGGQTIVRVRQFTICLSKMPFIVGLSLTFVFYVGLRSEHAACSVGWWLMAGAGLF
jgi:hypothetical protein